MPPSPDPHLLERLERYYDAAPRASSRTEEVGTFTLFVSTGHFPFYARPRLGLASPIEPADLTAVLARQSEIGVPEAVEWVVETTPSLSAAARAAGLHVQELPLLVLDRPLPAPTPPGVRVRRVEPNEPDLERILAVAAVAFSHGGTATGDAGPQERDELTAASTMDRAPMRQRLTEGRTVMFVAEDQDGPVASGIHQPMGDVTEVVAVGTLPSRRGRGLGAAVTAALVAHAVAAGVELVFLSAAGDEVARIYERLGFRRAALAGIAERPTAPAS